MGMRLGVDVGGTFTDFCLLEPRRGALWVFKRPSTPQDQSDGIAAGIESLLTREGIAPSAVAFLAHGTTVATNALLEHRGAPVGLLTTEGFRDVLELGRQVRPDIYDLSVDKPPLLVPGPWRHEVRERIGADGTVVTELDEAQARAAIRRLRDEGAQTIAVCLVHSYANPVHERRLGALIREEHPGAYVSLSSDVMPEFREFERWSSAALNSALGPVIRRYVGGLSRRVEALALPTAPQIMRSNGGIMSLAQAEALPISLLLSGPAAGVVGARWVARLAGFADIVTFDMGGTSTDVSLVRSGEATVGRVRRLGGYDVKQPMVDVHSIGAGGGSIARVDPGGFIQVGPESAGAVPGPAAYGLGGELPTVTDANVLTGRLGPGGLLGGRVQQLADHLDADLVGRSPVCHRASVMMRLRKRSMRATCPSRTNVVVSICSITAGPPTRCPGRSASRAMTGQVTRRPLDNHTMRRATAPPPPPTARPGVSRGRSMRPVAKTRKVIISVGATSPCP